MERVLTAKQMAFCNEYMLDRNASAAYVRAGYKNSSAARVCASVLLAKPNIRARVAELEAVIAEKVMFDATAVIQRFVDIATADPNELMQNRVGACRWCHGKNHQFQWRTHEEFQTAVSKWRQIHDEKKVYGNPEPSENGGYGYLRKRPPHQDCPSCEGFGENFIVMPDTTKLSRKAQALFAGAKQTKDGLEIKTNDQMRALEMLGKHLGVFKEDNAQKVGVTSDAVLLAFLDRINTKGSKLPLNRAATMLEVRPCAT